MSEVLAVLRRYDDDAWVALANKGLLRRARKDLEQGAPEVVAESNDSLQVRVADQVVAFGVDGPVGATCTCPSSTICQHLIAAGIWLAEAPATAEPEELIAGLLTLGRDALVEFAGAPAYRWARAYVDDLDPEPRVELGQQAVVSLVQPRVTFRYMGGGPGGMVADLRLPSIEKYQVAAVLVVQRANGIELEPITRRAVVPGTRQLVGERAAVRAAVVQLLIDTVRLGVAHLSGSVLQRYETLAVSAQGAEYYRLAMALRGMGGQIELALARSARADEEVLLEQAATAYALVSALETGDSAHLVGTARSRYDAVRKLELFGLGSVPWRTASGYAGLSTLFWAPGEDRFVSWSDSRPVTVAFEPRARYTSVAPWVGLESPAQATGARLSLSDAKLAGAGRLSGVESTRALVQPQSGAELVGALPVVGEWAEFSARRPVSLLDPADPLRDWAVLRPAEFAPGVLQSGRATLGVERRRRGGGDTATTSAVYNGERPCDQPHRAAATAGARNPGGRKGPPHRRRPDR